MRRLEKESHVIAFMLPLKTVNESNRRDHWAASAKRHARQRVVVKMTLWARCRTLRDAVTKDQSKQLAILLTRYSRGKLDTDGVVSAMKSVRDEVAACLGFDDGETRVTWHYHQEHVVKGYAIQIRIEEIEMGNKS